MPFVLDDNADANFYDVDFNADDDDKFFDKDTIAKKLLCIFLIRIISIL